MELAKIKKSKDIAKLELIMNESGETQRCDGGGSYPLSRLVNQCFLT